jgi:hypothetical protein
MTKVTITGQDGRERVVELDDEQLKAMRPLRKADPFVSSSGKILKEPLDSLDRERSSRLSQERDSSQD